MSVVNNKLDRTFRYKGLVQIQTSDGTFELKFCKNMEIIFDDSEVQRDRIDDGTPVFTRAGDVMGTFKFLLKNTVDLYDSVNPPVSQETVSFWQYNISQVNYPVITFIETQNAPNSTGNKFSRINFTARMMKCTVTREDNVAVEEVECEGEITAFNSSLRSAS